MSGRLLVPLRTRPRRPLSNNASTASCSMRCSFRTITSGARSSSSRRSRLLRLMTFRYSSFRSLVANRPPSRGTRGRRSGGMTGMTSMTIHSGRFPDLRKASTTFSRLAALVRFWMDLSWRIPWRNSTASVSEIGFTQELLRRSGAHSGAIGASRALQLLAELIVGASEKPLQQPVQILGHHLALAQFPSLTFPDSAALVSLIERECEQLLQQLSLFQRQRDFLFRRSVMSTSSRIQDYVRLVVENSLQFPRCQIEHLPDAARRHLEEPDMRDRAGQFNVPEPAASYRRLRDFPLRTCRTRRRGASCACTCRTGTPNR